MPDTHAKWYHTALRRSVLDMHIPDWNPSFLSQYDPAAYLSLLEAASIQSAVLYAHSHVGLFNYPSQIGPMHRGLANRDIFGEMVDECHRRHISAVGYCSLIFDRWAYDQHPDWRIILTGGEESRGNLRFGLALSPRHGLCCPNAPGYRNYITDFAREMCTTYPLDGIRFDMTFWPAVCYCPHCEQRFRDETGQELPRVIDWTDPRWVSFQRKREEWLVDFAALATRTARESRPGISVEHQSSTYILDWQIGVTDALAACNDFLQGDFYGGPLQGTVARKLFWNISPAQRYGFETGVCTSLENHTNVQPLKRLTARAYAALADDGAMVFIDGVDPVGTLNPTVYRRWRAVSEQASRYDSFRGGDLLQDVGVYLSTISKFDPVDNGKSPNDPSLSHRQPHIEALMSACRSLVAHHVPFGVISRPNLDHLSRYQAIVLPDVLMMSEEEARAFRGYVAAGGKIVAGKHTSLTRADGTQQSDFMLADVLGVSYAGETAETYTYVSPVAGWEHLLTDFSAAHPLGLPQTQMVVTPHAGSQVLANIVLPYTDPRDCDRFASIHSNPPGIATDHPALVLNRYELGQTIYAAGAVEPAVEYGILPGLLRLLDVQPAIEVDGPSSVEVTLFHQPENRRFVVNLVSYEVEPPDTPVHDITLRVDLRGAEPKRVALVPEGVELKYRLEGRHVVFRLPSLSTFAMVVIDCA